MKSGNTLSLKKCFAFLVVFLIIFMIILQFIPQAYYINSLEESYSSATAIYIEQIVDEINESYRLMNLVVESLADNPIVKDYSKTTNTGNRYTKAYNSVRPIVEALNQITELDYIIVTDVSKAWYRFDISIENTFPSSITRIIDEKVADIYDTENILLTVADNTYFCVVKPIFVISSSDIQRIGYVAALTDIEKTRSSLVNYSDDGKFTISLHNFNNILISSNPELEHTIRESAYPNNSAIHISEDTILSNSLGITISISNEEIFPQRRAFTIQMFVIISFSIIIIIMTSFFINYFIVRPFTHVIDETEKLDGGDFENRITNTNIKQVDTLISSINNMLNRLQNYNNEILSAQEEIYQMKLARRDTQLYLLRKQIDRHLLYNSLISVKALADRGENEKVKNIIEGIASLMRYVTSQFKEVNFFDEMEIIRCYVNIQNIRFDDGVAFEIDVDDRLCDYKIIKLLIQPLVENALVHGLESKKTASTLWLRGYLKSDHIIIEVEDNGAGIPSDQLSKIQSNIKNYESINNNTEIEGIALVNIQQRIRITYGQEYGLELTSQYWKGTLAILKLPCIPYNF